MPARAPASAAMTVTEVQTSPRVCIASASSTSLASRAASRDSYRITKMLIATVITITTKLAGEISCGAARPVRWLKALRSTSTITKRRNSVTAAAATVSYFRCP